MSGYDETSLVRAISTSATPGDVSSTLIHIGAELPADSSTAYARAGMLEKAETLRSALDGSHLDLAVVGLGGGTGNSAVGIIAAEGRIEGTGSGHPALAQLSELSEFQIVIFPNDEYIHDGDGTLDDLMNDVDHAILATASPLTLSLAGSSPPCQAVNTTVIVVINQARAFP